MKRIRIFILLQFLCIASYAALVSGYVSNENGEKLPFASILIKGTTKGTTANSEGKYFLHLNPGDYTIVCQYVGYKREEKVIHVGDEDIELNFKLSILQLDLSEIVIKKGDEDPAYAIIREAIKKRPYYANQVEEFKCEVYIKGLLKLRDYPKKFMGQPVDFEDGDTSKRKIIFLSETIADYSVQKPNKVKVEVKSTKVSGQSDGFGFSNPEIISFYQNNITIGRNLNPRGFISPIANGALSYYRYKYMGSFFEDGKEISTIRVIPKRKFEPLFSGTINIVIDDWRIHSLKLQLTKESQMDFVDTLNIEQVHVPVTKDVWMIKSQVIYPAVKFLGFDATGSFVSVYSNYDLQPGLGKKDFSNTLIKFEKESNKKPVSYWDSIRPVPLKLEESLDYAKKDSLEQLRKDPHYLDSIDRKRNKITLGNVLLTGKTLNREKEKKSLTIKPVIQSISFNTAEGLVPNLTTTYRKRFTDRDILSVTPYVRYGFSNHHFNAHLTSSYRFGSFYISRIAISGGKRIYQFNNSNPINEFSNTLSTLFKERNLMKLYEAWYVRIHFIKGLGNGLTLNTQIAYQDRIPLNNTTNFKIKDRSNYQYSPNYPEELMNENFKRHRALIAHAELSWKPGSKYIEFPDRIINIGSKWPLISFSYSQGVHGLLGSDISYSKWQAGIRDNFNFKIGGSFSYNLKIGGFFKKDSVAVPDYYHFNGNQSNLAAEYLNSFQLLNYYRYSNQNSLYTEGHAEYHLNGLLTNKIPVIRKLNWHLVTGSNALYLDDGTWHYEIFAGLENIFRVGRLDVVKSWDRHDPSRIGIRFSFGPLNSSGDEE